MHERHFQRVPFDAEVELAFGNQSATCHLLDIALKGALVETSTELAITGDTPCNLCITLPGTTIVLDFEAKLVHREETHYGFKFLSEDLETLTHLRKLLELNTGDPEGVRQELLYWLND
jgi:hypothetical protein